MRAPGPWLDLCFAHGWAGNALSVARGPAPGLLACVGLSFLALGTRNVPDSAFTARGLWRLSRGAAEGALEQISRARGAWRYSAATHAGLYLAAQHPAS